jgi:hypothetical protein
LGGFAFHQWFEVMWRHFPLMMVISSHHYGFMIEFNDSAGAHSAIWVKAHALTNV